MLPFLLTLNYQECNVRFVCFAWHHESGFLVLTTDLQGRHVFTWAKCKNCGGQSYKILCKRNVLPPRPLFPTYRNKYTYLVSILSTMKNLHLLVLYDNVFLSICCITCVFTHRSAPEFSVEILTTEKP